MAAGAALGVLTAVVLGVGSSMGAELVSIPGPEEQVSGSGAGQVAGSVSSGSGQGAGTGSADISQGADYGWRDDFDGYRRYYGADGMVLTNTITPDGQYVDETGVWYPRQYDVSKFTSIPADAKSLLVIEGHGKAARATFYMKEEIVQETETAGRQNIFPGPGAAGQPEENDGDQEALTADRAIQSDQGDVQNGLPDLTYQWKMLFDTSGYVGKNGIGKVQEGDEKSPRGLYTLDEAFGTKPDPGNFKVPYLQVNDGHYWVGDSNSPLYNTMVDIRQTGEIFNTAASEHLSTYGGKAYYYCMAVGYNKERTPYKGSAIFLHCTDGPGTGGCIAIPESAMVTVLENIEQPAYILIDDGENLGGY